MKTLLINLHSVLKRMG